MLNKVKSYVAIWNVAAFVFCGIIGYYGVTGLIDSLSACNKFSRFSSVEDMCGQLSGYMVLFVAILVIAVAGIVFGMMNTRRVAEGSNPKTMSGLISAVSGILLHGFFVIMIILALSDASDKVYISSSNASQKLFSIILNSLFSTGPKLWVPLILAVMNFGLSILGLVFILTYKPKAEILSSSEDNSPIPQPMSVVQQFAKPEKKDLPPMLNGDESDAAAAPAQPISGLKTISPIDDNAAQQVAEAPAGTPVTEAPAEMPAEAPAETPVTEAPAEMPAEVPAGTPVVEAPAEMPAEMPATEAPAEEAPVAEMPAVEPTTDNQEPPVAI